MNTYSRLVGDGHVRATEHSSVERRWWYVVYCKSYREETAKAHLELKRLEVFHPRVLVPECGPRGRRVISLFPNYLFVRAQMPEDYYHVVWSPGVKRFVSFGERPASIEDGIVEFLMQRANPQGIITAQSSLTVGQEIRISSGPFDGLVGIIQDPPDPKKRVKILLSLLGCQVKVELPIQYIRDRWIV